MALMAKFPAFFTGFPFGTILEILQNQPGNSGRVALVIQGDFHQIGGVYKFALPGEAFHKTIDAHFHRGTPDVGDFPMQDDCTVRINRFFKLEIINCGGCDIPIGMPPRDDSAYNINPGGQLSAEYAASPIQMVRHDGLYLFDFRVCHTFCRDVGFHRIIPLNMILECRILNRCGSVGAKALLKATLAQNTNHKKFPIYLDSKIFFSNYNVKCPVL